MSALFFPFRIALAWACVTLAKMRLFLSILTALAFCLQTACAVPGLKQQSENQEALIAKVKRTDAKDPRLFFLETQADILKRLTERYKDRTGADYQWLEKLVDSFMSPLRHAFNGNIAVSSPDAAINDAAWKNIARGEMAGFWWKAALDDAKKAPLLLAGATPKPQDYEIAAFPLMLAHIWYDLRLALLLHGPGPDKMWKEVEEVVKSAWAEKRGVNRSMMDALLGVANVFPSLKTFNPVRHRDTMRTQVIEFLKSKSVDSPYLGIVIDKSPAKGAFPAFGY